MRKANLDQSSSRKILDTSKNEMSVVIEKPKKKMFKSFIDSYISEARKVSDDESKQHYSRESSYSTE